MDIKKLLREEGFRVTTERVDMYDFVTKKQLFSAKDLIEALPQMGRASIFRNIKVFLDLGLIRRVIVGNNSDMYELVDTKSHHEYVSCNECGKVEVFEMPEVCHSIAKEAEKRGYKVTSHSVNIAGKCNDC